jgi:hypothetical protein
LFFVSSLTCPNAVKQGSPDMIDYDEATVRLYFCSAIFHVLPSLIYAVEIKERANEKLLAMRPIASSVIT